jgi:segregation and condensation protein A
LQQQHEEAREQIQAVQEESMEILVDLARSGEIDPWDIDLETVTEKYLQAIAKSPINNLREAGKAIFYASVLLRMKSDILSSRASETLNIGFDDDFAEELYEELHAGENRQVSFKDLERALRRKSILKAKRYRKLTLEDLISALKDAQREEENRQLRASQQKFFNDFDESFIVEPEIPENLEDLTHAENLEGDIEKLQAYLEEYLIEGKTLEFTNVINFLGSWSSSFLSVIFLAHENLIELEQGEFYGELKLSEPKS